MQIENDNGLLALLASEVETRISTGYTFTEGPVWVPSDNCLLFSDIPGNRIHRWRPGDDADKPAETYREPSRNSNGLTLDHEGRLLACEHSGRQVTRAIYGEPEEPIVTHVNGKRLNSPNDIVVHSSGAIYFTDPTYGLGPGGEGKELPHNGVYRITTDGQLDLLDDRFQQPNGLAFSPDESVLYVGDSLQRVIRSFRVEPDGTILGGKVFVDMRDSPLSGLPDGMKVDTEGRLWTTGAGGPWVIEPDGTLLGTILLPENPANLTFGGPDFSTLYLTAYTSVYAIETKVRGVVPGSAGAPGR